MNILMTPNEYSDPRSAAANLSNYFGMVWFLKLELEIPDQIQ